MHGKNHILITSYKRFITTKWMAVNVPGKNLLYISCHFSMTNLFCIYLVCCQYQYRYHYLPTYPSYLRKSFGPLFQTTQGPRVVKHHQAFGETRLWHFSKSIWEIPVPKFGSWKRTSTISYSDPNSKRGIKSRHLQLHQSPCPTQPMAFLNPSPWTIHTYVAIPKRFHRYNPWSFVDPHLLAALLVRHRTTVNHTFR